MNATNPNQEPAAGTQISSADFPVLCELARGYLHEDWKDQYGSADSAVRQFCKDADATQRQDLAKEWEQFLERTKGLPLAAVGRLLTVTLGGCWIPTRAEDLRSITTVLRQFR